VECFSAIANLLQESPKMLREIVACGMVVLSLAAVHHVAAAEKPEALSFEMKTLDGKDVDLSEYQGKVVLIVNVASKCGLTPQYEQLQALHEKYKDAGLAVLGFPCNQFGKQEPGTATEIREFCSSNYGVSFDMFSKVDVNGDEAAPLYKYLTSLETQPTGAGKISWNFEKFLIDRQGNVVARFAPRTRPDDAEVVGLIEKSLEQAP
jgi:glutathione peroxidase